MPSIKAAHQQGAKARLRPAAGGAAPRARLWPCRPLGDGRGFGDSSRGWQWLWQGLAPSGARSRGCASPSAVMGKVSLHGQGQRCLLCAHGCWGCPHQSCSRAFGRRHPAAASPPSQHLCHWEPRALSPPGCWHQLVPLPPNPCPTLPLCPSPGTPRAAHSLWHGLCMPGCCLLNGHLLWGYTGCPQALPVPCPTASPAPGREGEQQPGRVVGATAAKRPGVGAPSLQTKLGVPSARAPCAHLARSWLTAGPPWLPRPAAPQPTLLPGPAALPRERALSARPLQELGHGLGEGLCKGRCPRPAGTYLPLKTPSFKNSKWPACGRGFPGEQCPAGGSGAAAPCCSVPASRGAEPRAAVCRPGGDLEPAKDLFSLTLALHRNIWHSADNCLGSGRKLPLQAWLFYRAVFSLLFSSLQLQSEEKTTGAAQLMAPAPSPQPRAAGSPLPPAVRP